MTPKWNMCPVTRKHYEETASKIKRALKDNITKEYKDELMKNKASANVTATITGLPTDKVHEIGFIDNEMYDEVVKSCLYP